jgi:hypothetical protein
MGQLLQMLAVLFVMVLLFASGRQQQERPYALERTGPYVHERRTSTALGNAEGGGLPFWVKPEFELRAARDRYLLPQVSPFAVACMRGTEAGRAATTARCAEGVAVVAAS